MELEFMATLLTAFVLQDALTVNSMINANSGVAFKYDIVACLLPQQTK